MSELQPGDRAHLPGRIEERFTPPDDQHRVFVADGEFFGLISDHSSAWDALQPAPQPTPQPTVADLIAAEQARARRRHPNDHAGHPDTTDIERLNILDSEFDEVEREISTGNHGTAMVWEVLQVAAVAAAWVEAWLADPEAMPASDLLAIIEDGVIR